MAAKDLIHFFLYKKITRIGSDHSALLVDSGNNKGVRSSILRFEPSWVSHAGFKSWLISKWPKGHEEYILDHYEIARKLRRSLRGLGANIGREVRQKKQALLLNINRLDKESTLRELTAAEWDVRHKLEAELMEFYQQEEIFWRKRGGETWLLKGDTNTGYFHRLANSRKRKCLIKSLEAGDDIITETE
ncbi:hypothetical protein C2845_PM15G00740 [Panicum miliaceum]|uniref:Uncharacterized protein n=1 Tax=Panicum miliaceum TaxID=4540 RepID=A0A3L6Q6C4_PANMI|nr:hypothetical protein C2845_PM15G00740 [Panicum miliaceum]